MTLPTGTLTFVFTDIEGSTSLLSALGDEYPKLLDTHHRILRTAFEGENGIEISTEGDSFFVVFESAPAALRAAVSAQRAFAAQSWPQGAEVRVRMGLHTGEGRLVGDNYGGLDVHRAARIADAGHGGQVLLSDSTRALVELALPGDASIRDLGTHRLKGLESPERLYQVSVAGIADRFPPLRSIDARPNNLPVALTSFIARSREVGAVKDFVQTARLVTLTGPGGTGKTRVALQVASELLMEFADGAFFVGLAPVTDPRLVASEIADALEIREEKERSIGETLKDHLSSKNLLLVLDNFEQIIEAGSFVAELLACAPRVSIVVTSRTPLRIYGEQEYEVPPMTVPSLDGELDPVALEEYEAVAMFLQRARAVHPGFVLTAGNAPSVVSITEKLDGLPLAIELVASRTKLLGPGEILERIDDSRLRIATGARDLPERQRTLRGAIGWSYDLLDEKQRTLFRRLGVFAGGWTFTAAEAVCNPGGELEIETLDGLDSLLDNSLIRRIEDERGEARFRMLQTIRDFSLEMLDEEESELVHRRHAHFFCDLAEKAAPQLTGEGDWIERLSADHDNFRAALRWALDSNEGEIALRMAAALWRFWYLRGHLAEGRRWLAEALEVKEPTPHRAAALVAIGSVAYWQNDFTATRIFYEEALEINRKVGNEQGVAEALYNLGFTGLIESDFSFANECYTQSRDLYERLSDAHGVASATWGLAMAALLSENLDAAAELGEETRLRFRALDDWFGQFNGMFVIYDVERRRGNFDAAERLMLEVVEGLSGKNDLLGAASVLEEFGNIEIHRGRPRRGLRLAGAAAQLKKTAGGGAPPALVAVPDARELVAGNLPEKEMAELWAEGGALSLDEALAYLKKAPEGD